MGTGSPSTQKPKKVFFSIDLGVQFKEQSGKHTTALA